MSNFTIIGKYFMHGITANGEPYEYYRVYCSVSPTSDEVNAGFEGLKTKAFNFSPALFKTVHIGETFNEPLFNDARLDKDKCVRYLLKD